MKFEVTGVAGGVTVDIQPAAGTKFLVISRSTINTAGYPGVQYLATANAQYAVDKPDNTTSLSRFAIADNAWLRWVTSTSSPSNSILVMTIQVV